MRGRWNPSDQADELLVNQNLVEAGKLRWVAEDKTERELPVYQVSELDSATVLGANISDIERLQRRLMQNGVQLDVETEFLEAPLPDGRQLVVPVRNVNLRSLGQ